MQLQIEEKLKKKKEEDDAKAAAMVEVKDPKDVVKQEASTPAVAKGPSVKNTFNNDGSFLAQFRQQMKVQFPISYD